MKTNSTTSQREGSHRLVYAGHVKRAGVGGADSKRGGELQLTTDKGPVVIYFDSPEERARLAAALGSERPLANFVPDEPDFGVDVDDGGEGDGEADEGTTPGEEPAAEGDAAAAEGEGAELLDPPGDDGSVDLTDAGLHG